MFLKIVVASVDVSLQHKAEMIYAPLPFAESVLPWSSPVS
jgi:hypothetical protein